MNFERFKNSVLVKRGIKILKYASFDSQEDEQNKTKKEILTKKIYDYYDSTVDTYLEDFKDFLKPFENFNEYIKNTFGNKIGSLVGIELGGPGNNFFSSFEKGMFKKTAGFTLTFPKDLENVNNHEVVESDVFLRTSFTEGSWGNVLEWVNENGHPDFIIERMIGPLFMVKEPKIFLLVLDRWYRILNDGGEMFIEVPKNMKGIDYSELIDYFSKFKVEGLDIQIGRGHATTAIVLKIKKLNGAPVSIANLIS